MILLLTARVKQSDWRILVIIAIISSFFFFFFIVIHRRDLGGGRGGLEHQELGSIHGGNLLLTGVAVRRNFQVQQTWIYRPPSEGAFIWVRSNSVVKGT
jgi:hypothetical protein